jgi:glycosyltransferase involved in cell wall biosynthesis
MPSRSPETAGYIPVEAASRRVMSIVCSVGGLPETAGPDCPTFTAGRADELAQLMIRFLDDPGAALANGYAAYRRAQELYSPRVIVDELLRLLAAKKSPQKDADIGRDLDAAQRDAQPEHR